MTTDDRDATTAAPPAPGGVRYGTRSPRGYLLRERAAEERHEFWDGDVVAMAGGSRRHSRLETNLAGLLFAALGDGPCHLHAGSLRVGIPSANAYVYPDLSVVCGEDVFEDDRFDTLLNPAVVLEVLSPGTERHDRGRKLAAYRTIPSVREVVLLAQDAPRAEIHRRAGAAWETEIVAGWDGEVVLRAAGVRLAMAALYRRVLEGEGG